MAVPVLGVEESHPETFLDLLGSLQGFTEMHSTR